MAEHSGKGRTRQHRKSSSSWKMIRVVWLISLTKVTLWRGSVQVQVLNLKRNGACPMQRAEKKSEGWKEQSQVGEEVQESSPRPWEATKSEMSRQGQWQIIWHFLKKERIRVTRGQRVQAQTPCIQECQTVADVLHACCGLQQQVASSFSFASNGGQ